MPKFREDSAKLREMRIKSMKQKAPGSPSEIYLCVLGSGAAGSPRCLYVFTDHSRYLFNCGEGTQRLAHEYKMKLSKLNNVFITHNSWENIGGLLGLSLTIQDIGVPQITLHGARNIEHIYTYTTPFVLTKGLQIDKRHHDEPTFVDNCMAVEYVPVLRTCSNIAKPVSTNDVKSSCKKRKVSSDSCTMDIAVSYICKGHSKKGHLLLQKCIELGVPSGPLLGELKNGKDVTLPCGKVVHSQDVISPEEPCPVFLVVECPSEEFLDPFVSESKFHSCQDPSSSTRASVIVHFTPSSILKTSKYQEWIHRFPKETTHLILNEDSCTLNSVAIHRVQCMLNLLHPRIYSLLHESQACSDVVANGCSSIVQAKTLHRYYIRPHRGLDKSCGVSVEPKDYLNEARSTPGFEDSLKNLHEQLQSSATEVKQGEEYPEIVFLGTGSSIPSKVRNVSGILVNISPTSSLFLDCGEGTYNQLFHLYGAKEARHILKNVSCIFISHLHADHHLGIFTLLKQRKMAFEEANEVCHPVTIIAPSGLARWFQLYSSTFEPISSLYRFIDCSSLQFSGNVDNCEELLHHLQNVKISTVSVQHCPNAYGVVLCEADRWKIVYSGDTIPCEQLVEAGKNCSLLIHEATMEDDLEDEAALKMHSTTSQAINIGERMGAEYTILTHFSQRYAKVPLFSEHFHSRVGCAFDNMKVRICDLPIVSLFNPTLQILFAENVDKLVDKGNKRREKLKNVNNCDSSDAIKL